MVAVENDNSHRASVIWLAHGASLLRCAPYQIRPVVEDAGGNIPVDPQAALEDLQASQGLAAPPSTRTSSRMPTSKKIST